ncbi:putative aspartokinase [Grifola frondosa]|uniref:aspartate kinase n=1 Tax=Grifola frondosa TaxID=5627 RepID=A0A1C7MRH0_GRIFR|nr:putative aspartokinase [Grifola frondosa]
MDSQSTPSPSSSRSSSVSSLSSPHTPPNLHQNTMDPSAKWLVQKFGGTSVGKFAVQIAEDIVSEYLDQHKVAIVCSARSGSTKALGTTNLLLRAAGEALLRTNTVNSASETPGSMTPNGLFSRLSQIQTDVPRSRSKLSPKLDSPASFASLAMSPVNQGGPTFNSTVDIIRSEHITAARSSVRNPRLLQELEAEIERDCDWLRSFLFATQVIDEISPRTKDSIIGFGERLACKIMTAILRDRVGILFWIDAEYVSLENVIPLSESESASETDTLGQDFYDRVAVAVSERIKQCGNRVPVVTGFFGPVPGSLLRQVGRGYTDLLAALLAAGLGASELQIWKEVDGIFTADPASEVVHPFTMEQVIRRQIPIRIKNVENPSGAAQPRCVLPPVVPITSATPTFIPLASPPDHHQRLRLPTAVTIKERIIVLNVNSNRKSVSHGFLAGIFGTLDKFGVVVDLISTSELLDRVVRELQKSGTVSVSRDMAILSLVGKQMRHMVGIAGRMFTTLGQGSVNIEMISQGANEINISRKAPRAEWYMVQAILLIADPLWMLPTRGRERD